MASVSFSYSVPYLIVLSIFLLCFWAEMNAQKDKQQLQVIRWVCCTTFFFFFGFRGLVGWDWVNYYPAFEDTKPLWGNFIQNFDGIQDPGYVVYVTLIRSISSSYQFFTLISVLIDVMILNLTFKRYSSHYALSFAVFMVVSLNMEIDTLRNMKSIMVFLLALPYLQQRKFMKYMLLVLLAVTLHISAIFYVPFYFFGHRRFSFRWFLLLFIVGNAVYLTQIPIIKPLVIETGRLLGGGRLAEMINAYMSSDIYSSARGITISYLERVATTILVLCYYNKLLRLKETNVLFVNIFILYVIVTLFMSEISVIFVRVGALFVISYWIIWPALADCFSIRNNFRIYLICLSVAACLFVTVRSMSVLYKYDNFFTGTKSFADRYTVYERVSSELIQN